MNKKIKIIELLQNFADEKEIVMPKYIRYWDRIGHKDEVMLVCKENIINKLDDCKIDLNDEVEILEDNTEKQKNLGESWKEVGKRVGEWAKEFDQGFKESFTKIVRYPFEKLEDNTEEIKELKYDVVDENGRGWYKLDTIADKVTELVKAVNQIRKDLKNG